MRLLVNSLVVIMILAILGGAVVTSRNGWTRHRAREAAHHELARFQREIAVQSQLGQTQVNEYGYPTTVDPAWFAERLPDNPMLSREHPWVEIADAGQADRMHPLNWATADESVARFWYNPRRGIVRARVPWEASEATAMEHYVTVNGERP